MNDPEYNPIPDHTAQDEAMMLLGQRLANKKLNPKDLAAVISEYHFKPPQVTATNHDQNVKLLASPKQPMH